MSTELPMHTQRFSGPPAGKPVARPLDRKPELSDTAKRQDDLDNRQFEKQAGELAKPTAVRPALIAADEVESIRTGYGTGSGRLNVLTQVTNKRLDFWTESSGGGAPFDPISDADRAKCQAFFAKHGVALAGAARQAPPNPLRRETPPAGQLTEMRGEADLARNQAVLDAGAKARETAAPAEPQPKTVPPSVQLPIPPAASLRVRYLSAQGYECELTEYASTGAALLEKAAAILAKLEKMQAKPLPAPVAPAAVAPQGKPVCPVHHKPMKPSKKPGTWFCPVKDPDTDEYCDQKITI